jgi:hypothetical protein
MSASWRSWHSECPETHALSQIRRWDAWAEQIHPGRPFSVWRSRTQVKSAGKTFAEDDKQRLGKEKRRKR